MFTKLLIANRGEIACRVIRTAHRLGIQTVAVYSDADANALHVTMADEAVHIGGAAPADSYLRMDRIIAAAQRTGAQAIHPGYGFLSENAEFARRCADHDLVFVGPPAAAIDAMGSKSAAKHIMGEAGVPLLPGYHDADQNPEVLRAAAEKIGYPVLLKAVAGGGGKGMRQVISDDGFDEALAAAKREAQSGFGDDAMLVEKLLLQPRHVEVQVFCDQVGQGVYLFERDCSVQRRHQKIIEEAPAPNLPESTRQAMGEAAVKAALAIDYVGAGTVEFLLAADGSFYFMEMNTRLQVEHPVTEMITRQDLVEWQLRVAAGQPLPLNQSLLQINGHAFEARIYAEDPDNDFLPASGDLRYLQTPVASDQVRIDSGVVEGDSIGVHYDPMIAKLVVWDKNRNQARQRLLGALADYRIEGVTTNIDFLKRLVSQRDFAAARLDTGFIDAHQAALFAENVAPLAKLAPMAMLYLILQRSATSQAFANTRDPDSPWHTTDGWRLNSSRLHHHSVRVGDKELNWQARETSAGGQRTFTMTAGETNTVFSGQLQGHQLTALVDGHRQTATVTSHGDHITLFTQDHRLSLERLHPELGDDATDIGGGFIAPMNGTVIDILKQAGDTVAKGETVLIMEAMKMEHALRAPADGTIDELYYAVGDLVDGGAELLSFNVSDA